VAAPFLQRSHVESVSVLLYYITDRSAFAGTDAERRNAIVRRIAEAARAGVDYIQLREKDFPARELEQLARQARRAVRDNSADTRLLINSRTDIALACGADGVHLPSDDIAASEARTLWLKCSDRQPVIGVSAHSIADVRLAESHGANFAVLAPIFEKAQTSGKGIGLEILRTACSPSATLDGNTGERFAVLALGGVNLENAGACLSAGATGVAGIRLFQTGAMAETVRRLRSLSSAHSPAISPHLHL
jgi:thiamine-phosphate pyrophosphorylase